MTAWSQVTWDTARAGGFLSYGLLTAAVGLGLVLGGRRQSRRWPRLVTNELHGYVSALALVFIVVHVLAVAVDPFTRFGLGEVLVPLVSHYRPVWMGLGIVALYLLLAVWATTKLRRRIGHAAWRRAHVLAFAVYAAATLHGLGTGSDTKTVWGALVYAGSVAIVGSLLALRLLAPGGRGVPRRPGLAAGAGLATLAAAAWALTGPFAAHWGAHAGGQPGSRAAVAARAVVPVSTHVRRTPSAAVRAPFTARFAGTLSVGSLDAAGRLTVRIDGALSGATRDHLEILLHGVPLDDGGVAMEQSRVLMGRELALYQGRITELRGTRIVADVRSSGQRLRLGIDLQIAEDGSVAGVVHGTRAGATA